MVDTLLTSNAGQAIRHLEETIEVVGGDEPRQRQSGSVQSSRKQNHSLPLAVAFFPPDEPCDRPLGISTVANVGSDWRHAYTPSEAGKMACESNPSSLIAQNHAFAPRGETPSSYELGFHIHGLTCESYLTPLNVS